MMRSLRRPGAIVARVALVCAALVLLASSPKAARAAGVTITTLPAANVSDTSATINWITNQALPGSGRVMYGTSRANLSLSAPESTIAGANGYVHTAQLGNLAGSTTYYFAINISSTTDNNGGSDYTFTTGPGIATIPQRFAGGQVVLSDGRPANGVLVTATILDTAGLNGSGTSTSAPISTLADAQGNWHLLLSPRTQDNNALFQFTTTQGDFLTISVYGGGLGQTNAGSIPITLNTANSMNVPSITIAPVTPTVTPTGGLPTATPTFTPTLTPTPPLTPRAAVATSTPTTPPSPSPSPTVSPSATWTPVPPASVATPLVPASIPVVPTQPPPAQPARQPIAPPVVAVPPPTPVAIAAPAPPIDLPTSEPEEALPPAPTEAPPTATPVTPSAALLQVLTPQLKPSSPTATTAAIDLATTPTPLPADPEPLGRALASTLGGLGLGGLGLALVILGIVKQRE